MDEHRGHGHGHGHDEALAALLDLDGEVLRDHLADVIGWVGMQTDGQPIQQILDVGAGTGTGSVALARAFPVAQVAALDRSPEFRARLEATVGHLGLADRVRTVMADLDEPWPALAPADLVWAANSLHEVADPAHVVAAAFAALRPGGLLAVLEMEAQPTFLAADNGMEQRLQAAIRAADAAAPTLGPDWGPLLAETGFDPVDRRRFTIELRPPHTAAIPRYAEVFFRRIRPMVADQLDAADLAALDRLLAADGPDSLQRRDDLVVRNVRTAWAARRP